MPAFEALLAPVDPTQLHSRALKICCLRVICKIVKLMKLSDLHPRAKARVRQIYADSGDMEAKLREVGFSEGDEVEMIGFGPFGNKTLAVRLNRTIIALRAQEAAFVEVDAE
jgi:Fe2+ transport system protein FeoA